MPEKNILEGAYDLHVHAGPDIAPRKLEADEVVREALDYRMAGVLFKNYSFTTEIAYFLDKTFPEINVYGAVTLDYTVGGLNPIAVETALKLGAKRVFMPKCSATSSLERYGLKYAAGDPRTSYTVPKEAKGIIILNEKGKTLPEAKEILNLIAQYNAILETCHLSIARAHARLGVISVCAGGFTCVRIRLPFDPNLSNT